jgi:hypothetical protein
MQGADEQTSKRARWRRAARFLALAIRCARLAAFCTVALIFVLVVSASRVRGDVGEKMITLGRELLPMADLLQKTQRARVNGESIYLASTVVDQSIGEVLDRYQAHCQQYTGGLAEQFDALPERAKKELASRAPAAWNQRLGIVREQRDGEGMVVCIAQNGGGGIPGFVARVNQFLDDGELSHLGNLRYAYVSKTESGKTHLLTTFTEGSFNLYKVIGTGETPRREELDGVPLPANAVMPMTFRVDDMPYAVQAFQSPQSPQEIAGYYFDALPRLGWEKIAGPGDAFTNVMMRRRGVTLLVTAEQLDDGSNSHVVVTEAAPTVVENPSL